MKKKNMQAFLLVLVAFGFHTSALIVLLVFVLRKVKFNKFSLLAFFVFVVLLTMFNSSIFGLLQNMAFSSRMQRQLLNYVDSSLLGQILSLYGICSLLMTYYLYTFIAVYWFKKHNPLHPILKFESFFVWGLIIVFASIPLSFLYRIARFYDLYFVMLFASFVGCNVETSFFASGKKSVCPYLLLIPFVILSVYGYFSKVKCFEDVRTISRIYPYETVFSRNIDLNRERLFHCYGLGYKNYDINP